MPVLPPMAVDDDRGRIEAVEMKGCFAAVHSSLTSAGVFAEVKKKTITIGELIASGKGLAFNGFN